MKIAIWQKRWVKLRLSARQRWSLLRFKVARSLERHSAILEAGLWLAVITLGLLLVRPLQDALTSLLDRAGADAVRDYIKSIGLGMVGATAIAASFILFALQVNVERLPHGLFRKFSIDARLLWSVATSLLLAIGGTAISLVTEDDYLAATVLCGALCLAAILRLLFYAYRRSLRLVDPGEQIGILTSELARSLRRWGLQVDALAGMVELPDDINRGRLKSQIDYQRLAVLQANPHWANPVKATVNYLAAYAQRAGMSGDDDTGALALARLLQINDHYITVKGRTFFANSLVVENPLVTDGVVNDTLESLKELVQAALSRRDERQLRQVLRMMANLVSLYARIEYGSPSDTKSHAHLAAGYLKNAVEDVLPTGLTNTTMVGVQKLGQAALAFLAHARPEEAVDLIKQIGLVGSAAMLKPNERPVTLIAAEELRNLTLQLLRVQGNDPGFAFQQLRQAVQSLSQAVLGLPDQPLFSGHSFYLGPYFSATSMDSLPTQLSQLADALHENDVDEAAAKRVVRNIGEWSDGLYQSQKAILLLAAEKRSQFFFDAAHWITTVSEILLAVARAPAAEQHWQDKLRRNAHWLLSTLGWLPTDKDTAQFVEGWSHLENLTEFALNARRCGELECYDAATKIMFDWAFKAGVHRTGWATLARGLIALVGLSVTRQDFDDGTTLQRQVAAALQQEGAPDQEHRQRAATNLLKAADEVRDREYDVDLTRRLLAAGDRQAVRQLLRALAELLVPGSSERHQARPRHF